VLSAARNMTMTMRMVLLTVALLAATTALMLIQGISFPFRDALKPAALTGAFACAAYFCKPQPCRLLFKALAVLLAYVTIYPVAMYVVATTGAPFADEALNQWDFGIAPWAFRNAERYPLFGALLLGAYNSAIPQMIILLLFLSATKEQGRLDAFVLRFILGTLITLVMFYFWPAKGTVYCGLPTPEDYQPILTTLDQLRAGVTTISCQGTLGLVTFPSFHAIWAVLLIAAFYRHALFLPMLILNVLMLWSTMTVGMHYSGDVIVALLICAVIIPATRPASIQTATAPRSVNTRWWPDAIFNWCGVQPATATQWHGFGDLKSPSSTQTITGEERADFAVSAERNGAVSFSEAVI
jgi:membrane-associated phospholipid phosphatase